jgi:hypothetical protein
VHTNGDFRRWRVLTEGSEADLDQHPPSAKLARKGHRAARRSYGWRAESGRWRPVSLKMSRLGHFDDCTREWVHVPNPIPLQALQAFM